MNEPRMMTRQIHVAGGENDDLIHDSAVCAPFHEDYSEGFVRFAVPSRRDAFILFCFRLGHFRWARVELGNHFDVIVGHLNDISAGFLDGSCNA